MRLTEEQIKDFQRIYKKEFGKEISFEVAQDEAIKFLRMMKIIYRPITKEDQKKYSTLKK